MKQLNIKAQSTLEYILLLAAVVTFLVMFLRQNGFFYNQLDATYSASANTMTVMNNRLLSAYGNFE